MVVVTTQKVGGGAAILEGEITEFNNNFFIAFSSTNVGLKLRLNDKKNDLLWESTHVASSKAGTFPLSPIALASGMYSAYTNNLEEVALQMVDRRIDKLVKVVWQYFGR